MPTLEECARTNSWAMFAIADKKRIDEQRAKAANKSKETRKRNARMRELGVVPKKGTSEANKLTDFVLEYLRVQGYYAARINTGGTPIGATGAGGKDVLKWATSKSTKGVADIIACIYGRFYQFEIKAGKDRPRQDQLYQKELTQAAGGEYYFIHNVDEIIQIINDIKAHKEGAEK